MPEEPNIQNTGWILVQIYQVVQGSIHGSVIAWWGCSSPPVLWGTAEATHSMVRGNWIVLQANFNLRTEILNVALLTVEIDLSLASQARDGVSNPCLFNRNPTRKSDFQPNIHLRPLFRVHCSDSWVMTKIQLYPRHATKLVRDKEKDKAPASSR